MTVLIAVCGSGFATVVAMARSVTLSSAAVLALGGGIAWLVGSSALDAGVGTVVLALGIGVTVWLVVTGGRGAEEAPVERWRSRRLLQLVVVGIVLIAAASTLLGLVSYGELAVPVAFFVVGALLVPASSTLGDRNFMLLGSLLALNSVGELYPRGLVGLGAGAMLWAVSALRSGLLAPLQRR